MGEIAVAREELIELSRPLPEQDNAHGTVESGNETDEDGLAVNEDEGDRGVVSKREAANILKDIEAVALNNVFFSQKLDWINNGRGTDIRKAIMRQG
jgi:hypothetical protein